MVRRFRCRRDIINDSTILESIGKDLRDDEVVETQMRRPGGECISFRFWMKVSVSIKIIRVEHDLDCLPANFPATQPDQGAEPRWQAPDIKLLSWSEGVEVADQDVQTMLMLFDVLE